MVVPATPCVPSILSVASRMAWSASSLRGRPRPRAGASSAPARSSCFVWRAVLTRAPAPAASRRMRASRPARGCCPGSTTRASMAPASAVAAATVSVLLIAVVNAVSAAFDSARPALPPTWSATTLGVADRVGRRVGGRIAAATSPRAPCRHRSCSTGGFRGSPRRACRRPCRTVSFIAEPTPALSSGTELMIDSVAGAIVAPMPKPEQHERRRRRASSRCRSRLRRAGTAPPRRCRGRRRPRRACRTGSASFADSGPPTISPPAIGSIRTPASSGV